MTPYIHIAEFTLEQARAWALAHVAQATATGYTTEKAEAEVHMGGAWSGAPYWSVSKGKLTLMRRIGDAWTEYVFRWSELVGANAKQMGLPAKTTAPPLGEQIGMGW